MDELIFMGGDSEVKPNGIGYQFGDSGGIESPAAHQHATFEPNRSDALLGKESISPRVFQLGGKIFMPEVTINLKGDPALVQKEVNPVAAYFVLLLVAYPQFIKRIAHNLLKASLTTLYAFHLTYARAIYALIFSRLGGFKGTPTLSAVERYAALLRFTFTSNRAEPSAPLPKAISLKGNVADFAIHSKARSERGIGETLATKDASENFRDGRATISAWRKGSLLPVGKVAGAFTELCRAIRAMESKDVATVRARGSSSALHFNLLSTQEKRQQMRSAGVESRWSADDRSAIALLNYSTA